MKQNLLLITEHYPCGTQEGFLESEIEYLKELYRVHVITTDTDRLMTRALPLHPASLLKKAGPKT